MDWGDVPEMFVTFFWVYNSRMRPALDFHTNLTHWVCSHCPRIVRMSWDEEFCAVCHHDRKETDVFQDPDTKRLITPISEGPGMSKEIGRYRHMQITFHDRQYLWTQDWNTLQNMRCCPQVKPKMEATTKSEEAHYDEIHEALCGAGLEMNVVADLRKYSVQVHETTLWMHQREKWNRRVKANAVKKFPRLVKDYPENHNYLQNVNGTIVMTCRLAVTVLKRAFQQSVVPPVMAGSEYEITRLILLDIIKASCFGKDGCLTYPLREHPGCTLVPADKEKEDMSVLELFVVEVRKTMIDCLP